MMAENKVRGGEDSVACGWCAVADAHVTVSVDFESRNNRIRLE